MGRILAICISEKRGVQKTHIQNALLKQNWGIEGDAHAGEWHRQVSLISADKIDEFRKKGAHVDFGAFGENIVAEGIDFASLPVGTRLKCADAVLELTQIGKECRSHCAIYKAVGDCIMPREGVFARVLKDGKIAEGDCIEVLPAEGKRPFRAAVITLSDKAFKGEQEDKSGEVVALRLTEAGYRVEDRIILPDEAELLTKKLVDLADRRQLDLVITTGGTGFAPRDVTPEATLAAAEKNAPGISEAMRAYSMSITPRAMLSRGVSVIRKKTLIINLPGSPKACSESLDCILEPLFHGIGILRGEEGECAVRQGE